MRVSSRLWGALGVLVGILIVMLIYHVQTIRENVATHFELSDISARIFLTSSEQLVLLNDLEENAGKYWITGETGYLERFSEGLEEFDHTLGQLRARPLEVQEERAVQDLAREWDVFIPSAAAFLASRDETTGRAIDPLPALSAQLAELRTAVRRISATSEAVIADRLERAAVTAHRVERVSWTVAGGATLLSVLVVIFTVQSIERRLSHLKAGTRAVSAGQFHHRLETDGADEFSDLASDFNVMTQRLGELDRMKRDFLTKVSHDLKTPLASMQETTRVLLDELPGPLTANQKRMLTLNQQSGDRLSSMLADILDLSGLEAGAFRLAPDDHDLRWLVRASIDQLAPLAADRDIQLCLHAPNQPVLARCDGSRIIQVVANLVSNAVKFSPTGETVRITVRQISRFADDVSAGRWSEVRGSASTYALLSVADVGPGVSYDDKHAIFDRFVQTDAGRKVQGRGVGLGLTICRELVAAHEGIIWVDDNPGGGSVFHIVLPDARPAVGRPHGDAASPGAETQATS